MPGLKKKIELRHKRRKFVKIVWKCDAHLLDDILYLMTHWSSMLKEMALSQKPSKLKQKCDRRPKTVVHTCKGRRNSWKQSLP